MNEYKITCCSTCDLTCEHLKNLGIAFGTYHYIIDGKDNLDDLFSCVTPEQFYGLLNDGAMPTTSQVTPVELIDMIEPILKAGKDVLHIEFSSGLSGGWLSALSMRDTLSKKYPDREILIVDSRAASSGYGLLVDKAAQLKKDGMSIHELYAWLEENKLRLKHWFFTSNLAHLKRGGRVSGAAAFVGSIMKICPVMDVNSEGKLIVRKKVGGRKKALKELAAIMAEQAENGLDYSEKCFISNSMSMEDATMLASMIEENFPHLNGKVQVNNIGPVIGSHTGIGTIALFFFGSDKREI